MQPFPLMLFAAGFGTRMRPLTLDRPKPMIEVAGKPLIDHAICVADAAKIACRVVNLHYLGKQVAAHLAGNGIAFSWEHGRILDTGGGLRHALPLLGPGPVLGLNTDAIWTGPNPLTALMQAWNGKKMDALLLLLPRAKAGDASRKSDFLLANDGQISRAGQNDGHIYLGAMLMQTDLLHTVPEAAFSLNLVWDQMIAAGRAFGLVHQGGWCDVGTPAGIIAAEKLLAGGGNVF